MRAFISVCCVVALLSFACDGTLSGMHRTRESIPVVYPEPAASVESSSRDEPKQIRAQHLVVMHRDSPNAPPTMVRTRDEAKARAEEALAKIRNGADMNAIIAQYSDEPGAAERAGDLGKFSRKSMVRRFSDAAFKLKVGELSEVIETEFGFHVIRRTE